LSNNKLKYSTIEKSFLDFCWEAIDYMKSNLPRGTIEKTTLTKTIFDENGWHDEDVETYDYFSVLPQEWMMVLGNKPQTKKYIKIHNEQLNISFELQLFDLIAPLLDVVHQKLSFSLTNEELIEAYRTHKSHWVKEKKLEFHYIPLINFSSDLDVIITDFLSIKLIPNKLKTKFNLLYRGAPPIEFDLTTRDIWESTFMVVFKNEWFIKC
jgi:hypothetical protein